MIIIKTNHLIAAVGALCGWLLAAAGAAAGELHAYTVEVDADLRRLQIEARFSRPVSHISARSGSAGKFLLDAHDCNHGRQLVTAGRRIVTRETGVRCLSYVVDLQRAAQTEKRNSSLAADSILVSPTVWMWRPRLGHEDEIRVNFVLPESVQVSVPWQPLDSDANAFRLTASPQSGTGIAIFGRFDSTVTSVAGARLRIDLLRAATDYDTAAMIEWIRDTVSNIELAYGRFPNPAARIVVVPTSAWPWRDDSPGVLFGRVVRDGGETVELLIDPRQPMTSYYRDWTATHELSHLMLPYLQSEQRWVSEGFAQYYQNVLLARAGRYTQQYAWQKLHDGLRRGRESVPNLSPNQAASGDERSSRMKIYWSGAALALLADVELRRRSQGNESLDTVLDQFQRCCLPSKRSWSGRELFTKFDSFLQKPLFMDLYRQYADVPGFPDVRPVLERLGVVVEGGEVRFRSDAELAEIRATLTAQRYTDPPGN
jgi:hypothetical protein